MLSRTLRVSSDSSGLRSARFRPHLLMLIGVTMIGACSLLGVAPAQAAQLSMNGAPEGVDFGPRSLYHVDGNGGVIGSGPVGPGRTFFAVFEIRNSSDQPVTVTGFTPSFGFIMNPIRQGGLPDDHCLQFFDMLDIPQRDFQQSYPLVVLPGESVDIYDNMTYHYVHGPVSNECQGGSFMFGSPTFHAPMLPSADAGVLTLPQAGATPPARIETASA